MEALINNATSSFFATSGIQLSDVIDFSVALALQVAGLGLGLLQELMPVILVLIGISVVVGLVWAFFRFFRLRH